METIYFNNEGDKDKIISIPNLGSVGWTSFYYAFYGCSNLRSVAGGDTSQVTSLSNMFAEASQVEPLTADWNTGQVTDMSWIFSGAGSFNADISKWEVSQVTDMRYVSVCGRERACIKEATLTLFSFLCSGTCAQAYVPRSILLQQRLVRLANVAGHGHVLHVL